MTTTDYQGAVKAGRPLSPQERRVRCADLNVQLRKILAGYGTPQAQAAVDRIVAELAEHAADPQVADRHARPNVPLVFKHPAGSPAYVRLHGNPVEVPAAPAAPVKRKATKNV